MSLYKEIVTKAVIGKGKKYFKDNYNINVEKNGNLIKKPRKKSGL